MPEISLVLLRRATAGDRLALRELLGALTPVVQARVARALLRHGRKDVRRDIRQEVEDLTQQVYLHLFANDAHALHQWDPTRGLTFLNFVGLLAERQVCSILRSRRKNPWAEDLVEPEDLEQSPEGDQGPERMVASREMLTVVLRVVRERLSDRGLELFQWLLVEARPADEVCALTGMSLNAVYAWRSRLGRLVEQIAGELASEVDANARKPFGRTP